MSWFPDTVEGEIAGSAHRETLLAQLKWKRVRPT